MKSSKLIIINNHLMMLTVAAMMMKMNMTMRAIMMMMTPMTFDKVLPSRPEDTVPCQQPQLSAPLAPKNKNGLCLEDDQDEDKYQFGS